MEKDIEEMKKTIAALQHEVYLLHDWLDYVRRNNRAITTMIVEIMTKQAK